MIAPEVGGGFGNKVDVSPEEALTAIAAMKLGRPVKWSETRSENFQAAMHGRGQIDIIEAAVQERRPDHRPEGHARSATSAPTTSTSRR